MLVQSHDFSKGERGKFFRPDAELNLPVYLDDDVREFVSRIAESKDPDVTEVVNNLLRWDMDLAKPMQ